MEAKVITTLSLKKKKMHNIKALANNALTQPAKDPPTFSLPSIE
jgi:hypothetical protein